MQNMAASALVPEPGDDLAAALTALGRRILRFLLEDRAIAIHRVVVAESARFPELGRAFYENGPAAFRRAFGSWIEAQTAVGRLAVSDPDIAADQFVGMLRGTGVFLRISLGVPPTPTDAEIDATVIAAVRTFLKVYAPEA